MKNPYGILDGKLIAAADAERGLACNCLCPACNEKLQAHKGAIRKPYFSHYNGSDCGAGLETATHMLAKEIIEREKKLILPELVVYPYWGSLRYIEQQYGDVLKNISHQYKKEIVKAWTTVSVDTVRLEKKLGRIIPDVAVEVRGRILYVEIKVTHGIEPEKINFVREQNINVVEFDFSKMKELPDEKHLTKVLTSTYKGAKTGFGRSSWVNHSRSDTESEELTNKLKKKYPIKPPWEMKTKRGGDYKGYKPYH